MSKTLIPLPAISNDVLVFWGLGAEKVHGLNESKGSVVLLTVKTSSDALCVFAPSSDALCS